MLFLSESFHQNLISATYCSHMQIETLLKKLVQCFYKKKGILFPEL